MGAHVAEGPHNAVFPTLYEDRRTSGIKYQQIARFEYVTGKASHNGLRQKQLLALGLKPFLVDIDTLVQGQRACRSIGFLSGDQLHHAAQAIAGHFAPARLPVDGDFGIAVAHSS
jgi:hypothetical protein